MTTYDGKCCGNCGAFMPDPFNIGDQGACAVIDEDNIAQGTYWWTQAEGDCPSWTPRDEADLPKRSGKAELELYQKRMRGDWS